MSNLFIYTLRRSLIAVAAAAAGVAWKKIPLPDSSGWLVVTVVALLLVTLAALLLVDKLIEKSYSAMRWLRELLGYVDKSFIEGSWLDVGIQGSGAQRRAVTYSFIHVSFTDGHYCVQGWSWLVSDGSRFPWSSETSTWQPPALSFWYSDDRGPTKGLASRAIYRVVSWKTRKPNRFAGEYREGAELVETRAERASDEFLAWFTAQQSLRPSEVQRLVGVATLNASAVDGLDSADISDTTMELRQQLAKAYLDRVRGSENLTGPDYTTPSKTRLSDDYADWYETFLRQSGDKKAEVELLDAFFAELVERQLLKGEIGPVLDIGPGNGRLSAVALRCPPLSSAKNLRYTALEPNFALAEDLQLSLREVRPKMMARLMNQRLSEYIKWQEPSRFDLVIALHSLYFVDDADSEIRQLLTWLRDGSTRLGLLTFHTDWEHSDLLRALGQIAQKRLCNVVRTLADIGKEMGIEPIAQRSGDLPLTFPELKPAEWEQLMRRESLASVANVRTAAELLAFLVADRPMALSEADWQSAVQCLKAALDKAPATRSISMPLVIQFFASQPKASA